MAKKDFCCVGNYPVMIPYQDLENLLKIAQNYQESQTQFEKTLDHLEQKYSALQLMYFELVDKLAQLEDLI